ncbi:hypothetical protein BOTCAL_0153g00050 [Botryotinia calthae]|uniref:Uncharacterized protein n=1 Tax=Botryotinia calthae TaxID=38488 RepID=A0A4Y8D247_9HELO|nr:hypothetical protein BOTCAL_0153g00050 [Botryotinia calthae]
MPSLASRLFQIRSPVQGRSPLPLPVPNLSDELDIDFKPTQKQMDKRKPEEVEKTTEGTRVNTESNDLGYVKAVCAARLRSGLEDGW